MTRYGGMGLIGGIFLAWIGLRYGGVLFRLPGMILNPALPFDQIGEMVIVPGLTGFFPFIDPSLLRAGSSRIIIPLIFLSLFLLCPIVGWFLRDSSQKSLFKNLRSWILLGGAAWILRIGISFLPALLDDIFYTPSFLHSVYLCIVGLLLFLNFKLIGVPLNLHNHRLEEATRLSWKMPFLLRLGLIGTQALLSVTFFYGTPFCLRVLEYGLCFLLPPFSSGKTDWILLVSTLLTAALVLGVQTFTLTYLLRKVWTFFLTKPILLWTWKRIPLGDRSLHLS